MVRRGRGNGGEERGKGDDKNKKERRGGRGSKDGRKEE